MTGNLVLATHAAEIKILFSRFSDKIETFI